LEVEDVVVRYGAVIAVNQANLEVHEGEIVALIGPNGAGKTSLFNAIAGVVPLASGSVRFHGQSLDRLPPHGRARLGIGRTFQGGRLFGRLTLRENLELAHYHAGRSGLVSALLSGPAARVDRRRDRHLAEVALTAMGLEDFADTACLALPYGVQRRAEVARAVCLEPALLLLDEPSGGLDSSESADLAATIRRLRDVLGISVLLIEHDMDFVMNLTDYIYVLDFGNPLAEGTPDEIRSDRRVVAAYLGADVA
jgi:ABC-type branched-subunit amino acid transport system ATPase component